VLENRNVNDEERIVQLEKELEETIMLGEESDRKFEEVSCSLMGRSHVRCALMRCAGNNTRSAFTGAACVCERPITWCS